MKFLRSILLVVGVFQTAQAGDDFINGMKGLQQAAKDPELMAQLMKDLNDPKMMAEAKKMMENPEWKKEMRKLEENKEFQQSLEAVNDMMSNAEELNQVLESRFTGTPDEITAKNVNAAVQKSYHMFENLSDEQMEAVKAVLNDQEKVNELMKAINDNENIRKFLEIAEPTINSDESKLTLAKVASKLSA